VEFDGGSRCAIAAFKKNMKKTVLLTLTLAAVGSVTASAGTFLQVNENVANTPYVFTNNGGTSISLSVINETVDYKFFVPNALGTGFRTGTFNFTASSTTPAVCATCPAAGAPITEQGWQGTGTLFDNVTSQIVFTFSFGPTGSASLNNLQDSGGLSDAASGLLDPEVTFSSTVIDFSVSTSRSFGFAFSGANPNFGLGAGNFPSNAVADAVDTFSADPLPSSPEPASMALLGSALIGLGMIGRKRFAR
jgi:hypothetical protein